MPCLHACTARNHHQAQRKVHDLVPDFAAYTADARAYRKLFLEVTDDPRGAGQPIARNVVVATSLEPEAAAAVQWAAQQLCQKGDAVHLVHVARCMSTPAEVRSRHLSFGTTDIQCMT